MDLTIGVDVGGTKIAAGVVDEDGTILEKVRTETPATDRAAAERRIVDVIADLRGRHDVTAVGIGAPGYVDADRSTVVFAPNIDWSGEPLGSKLGALVGIPVVVENDANAAAWGEFRFGAGAAVDDLLLITVGTGVGGGIVTDGALYRGAFGIAAEVGHLRIVPHGVRCPCGQYGCWEQYASGNALVRLGRDRMSANDPAAKSMSDAVGGDPAALTGPILTAQAQSGDTLSISLLAEVGTWLGEGLGSLGAVLDPGMIAIGGGVAAAGALLVEPARAAYERTLTAGGRRRHAEITLATLGGEAGISGAADLARISR